MKNFNQPFQQQNLFNMGVATLMRIDNILVTLHEYNIAGNVILIQRTLYCLYKEVYPFLSPKEKGHAIELWKCIDNNGFRIADDHCQYDSGLSSNLNAFEFWLRDKLKEKNLLMKTEDTTLALLG
jgi:hypothetical protein